MFRKTHIVQQTKYQWHLISIDMFSLEIQEIVWDLSLMKISYNLTKRTKKTEKCFILFVINVKTIRYKLSALGKINPKLQAYESCQQFTAT